MSNRSSKVITGCGIGCGVFILSIIIGGVLLYTYIKNVGEDIDKIEEASTALVEKYGDAEKFYPEVPIAKAKIIQFLDGRDSLNSKGVLLTETIEKISLEVSDCL